MGNPTLEEMCTTCREARLHCDDCCANCTEPCGTGRECSVHSVAPGTYYDVYEKDTMPAGALPDGALPAKTPDEVLPAMNDAELADLERCEQVIQANLKGTIDLCMAMAEIKEKKLYRKNHKTFEAYCQEIWDISRAYAYRKIEAGRILKMLPMGDKPENERQIRPLTELDDNEVPQAWEKVQEKAQETGAKVTGRLVAEVVQEVKYGDPEFKKKEKKRIKEEMGDATVISDKFKKAYAAFLGQIQAEADNGWAETSKKAILDSVARAKSYVKAY